MIKRILILVCFIGLGSSVSAQERMTSEEFLSMVQKDNALISELQEQSDKERLKAEMYESRRKQWDTGVVENSDGSWSVVTRSTGYKEPATKGKRRPSFMLGAQKPGSAIPPKSKIVEKSGIKFEEAPVHKGTINLPTEMPTLISIQNGVPIFDVAGLEVPFRQGEALPNGYKVSQVKRGRVELKSPDGRVTTIARVQWGGVNKIDQEAE